MFIVPAAPVLADRVPSGAEWRHEPKIDGWRVQLCREGRAAQIFSRNGIDLTPRLPNLAAELRALPSGCVLDAELVVVLPNGRIDFPAIAGAVSPERDHALSLWAFDLLRIGRRDVRGEPLADRARRLDDLLGRADVRALRRVEAFEDGAALLRACEARGDEGVVSKRLASRYTSGRCPAWRKVKTGAWKTANAERWKDFREISAAPKG